MDGPEDKQALASHCDGCDSGCARCRADLGGTRARGSPRRRGELLLRVPGFADSHPGAGSGAPPLLPAAVLSPPAPGVLRAASRLLRLLRTAGVRASWLLLRPPLLLRTALPILAASLPWGRLSLTRLERLSRLDGVRTVVVTS